MNYLASVTRRVNQMGDAVLRRISPTWRQRRKYAAENEFWSDQLHQLQRWYVGTQPTWYGLPTPSPQQKRAISDLPILNAVMTVHAMRPAYLEQLQLPGDFFRGQKVLEIGCGPMVPIMQFTECQRYALDPLMDVYRASGWPLEAYEATLIPAKAEDIPYADGFFDAVISVNALDHVDDFARTAREMQRVLRTNGGLYLEVEYHRPTVTEPQKLSDEIMVGSFPACQLKKICDRGTKEVHELLSSPAEHCSNKERLVVWHGVKKAAT